MSFELFAIAVFFVLLNIMDNIRKVLLYYYIWRKSRRNRSPTGKKATKRRFWVRPIFRLRNELGAGNTLVEEMRFNPDNNHYNFFRMNSSAFDRLLSLVTSHILKSDLGREPINPQTRLAMTLRYLASGDSMTSLSYLFRVGKTTVSNVISDTVEVLWKVLQPLVLAPLDETGWKNVAEGFERQWNFPNCIGAIDGKHVCIQAPPHSGSSYYNYKGSHSLVLLAVVNHQYEFILVDIGGQGRQSDGGIFQNSLIGRKLSNKTLAIPPPRVISDGRPPLPYVIVGDEAFPLLQNLMRPYPGNTERDLDRRIYNYRHSRARRLSENCFGILVAQWRIFSHPIIGKLENIENIIKAAVCLHIFLIQHAKSTYITPTIVDNEKYGIIIPGIWRDAPSQLTPVRQIGANMYARSARDVREVFKDYFYEEGAVPWQWNIL